MLADVLATIVAPPDAPAEEGTLMVGRRLVGLIGGLGLAVVGTPSPAVAVASWTAQRPLSRVGVTAANPQVAEAANGDATVVWRESSSTGFRIMAARRVAGRAWGPVVSLAGTGHTPMRQQQVAMNAHVAVAVWYAAHHVMVSRHLGSSGWTRPVSVTRTAVSHVRDLAVAIDRRGDIDVVWSQQTFTPSTGEGVRSVLRPHGGHWGRVERLSGPSSRSRDDWGTQVAMDGRGDITVAWLRMPIDRAHCTILTTHRAQGARHWSARTPLGYGCAGGPWLAMNRRGDAAVSWEIEEPGHLPHVRAAVRPAGGHWHVSMIPSNIQGRCAGVAIDPAGRATVAWDEYDYQSLVFTVLTASRPVGGPWGAPVTVPDNGFGGGFPRFAVAAGGTTTLVWSQVVSPMGYAGLQAVQQTRAGAWGEVHSLSDGSHGATEIASDARGHAVVVWTERDSGTWRVMTATS